MRCTQKKELAVPNAPRLMNHITAFTNSTVTITQLIKIVNRKFPDVLPASVLKHFGHTSRPDGEIEKNALYSDRDQTYLDAVNRSDMETYVSEIEQYAAT